MIKKMNITQSWIINDKKYNTYSDKTTKIILIFNIVV